MHRTPGQISPGGEDHADIRQKVTAKMKELRCFQTTMHRAGNIPMLQEA